MKTKISFLIATILLFMLDACSKKSEVATPISHLKSAQNTTTYHDNGKKPGVEGVDYGCWGFPANCAEPVNIGSGGTIYGPIQNLLGVIATGVTEDIITAVSEYETSLLQVVDKSYIDGILDGTYTVSIRGGSGLSTNGPVYLVILSGTTVVAAYPLTTS